MKRLLTHAEVLEAAVHAASVIARDANDAGLAHIRLYGIPRGGIPAVYLIAEQVRREGFPLTTIVETPGEADFLIDDIHDTGRTAKRYFETYKRRVVVLFDKRKAPWKGVWLIMPWEQGDDDSSVTDNIVRLLQYIGEDPDREGLRETPDRVAKAWAEWSSGYSKDPREVLKTFEDGATDELVIVHGVPVVSKCEHHLADIIGEATFGYIPNGKIVGLSKIPRLIDIYARRLQVQERLTAEVVDTFMEIVEPKGCGLIIRAAHHCMSTRGVRIHGSKTTTSALRGVLKTNRDARAEFLKLCDG